AERWGVPGLLLLCQAEPAVVRARLENRQGDASDADWSTYRQAAAEWEQPGPLTQPAVREIDTSLGREQALSRALDTLRELDLVDRASAIGAQAGSRNRF